jgi:hypothetical protein
MPKEETLELRWFFDVARRWACSSPAAFLRWLLLWSSSRIPQL